MVLQIPGEPDQILKSIFPHSERFETGGGKERPGQATVVVSLDGTGDTDSIQEAIDLLPDTGGEVFIKEGTYILKENGFISINKSNLTIRGTGNGTVIKTTFGGFGIEAEIFNIGIANLKIFLDASNAIGISANQLTENVSITKINIEQTTSGMITGGFGIFLTGTSSKKIRISDCNFKNIATLAIFSTGNTNIISNNNIEDCEDGIKLDAATNSIVSSNSANNSGRGIDIVDTNGSSNNNSIIGNIAINGFEGIRINGNCDNNIVSGNQCNSNSSRGIHIITATADKNIIVGNVALNNTTENFTDIGTETVAANNVFA